MRDLGALGIPMCAFGFCNAGALSSGLAINNQGEVVGWSTTSRSSSMGPTHAFLYIDGQMRDLNDLIDPGAGFMTLTTATTINDKGQIVANGFTASGEGAFLLTPNAPPVPEPGTLALLGIAVAALTTRAAALKLSQSREEL